MDGGDRRLRWTMVWEPCEFVARWRLDPAKPRGWSGSLDLETIYEFATNSSICEPIHGISVPIPLGFRLVLGSQNGLGR